MSLTVPCPTKWLEEFVDDRLEPANQEDLIKHLDHCERCRRRLIEHAGSSQVWQTASEALSEPSWFDEPLTTADASKTDAPKREIGFMKGADPAAVLQLLSPTDDPRAAGRIGPFEVVGVVGSGGMGIVLKARDPALDRFVAIKILAPHLASSKSARLRFAREARAAAAVIHENVIEIHQVAHWNGLPYLVMPYLPDPSLGDRLEKEGRLNLEGILSIGLQIARGLSAAHTQGLVHRDVKPANILLCKGTERAIITDFGLARTTDDASLTRAGVLTGTPHYMSPEQAQGKAVDQRSDLFSLGSVLFAMACGRPPVDRESGSETIIQIADGRLPSLHELQSDLPGWFVKLVDWLHAQDPGRRPVTAGIVASLLEQCLAHHRQPHKTELPEQLSGSRRMARRWLGCAALVIACGLLLAFLPGIMITPKLLNDPPNSAMPESMQTATVVSNSPSSESAVQTRSDQPSEDAQLAWDYVEREVRKLEFQSTELTSGVESWWQPTLPIE